MPGLQPKVRMPADRAKRDCAIDQSANQSNTAFVDEKMQQLKRETLESEIGLQKTKLASKQEDQLHTGTKDTFKQSESLGENALAARREMLQNDLQNHTTEKDELGESWVAIELCSMAISSSIASRSEQSSIICLFCNQVSDH